MRLTSKSVSFRSPGRGTVAYEWSWYTRPTGPEKMRVRFHELRDDIYDNGVRSFSHDNGRTWPESHPFVMSEKRPDGMLRRMEGPAFLDPVNNRLVQFIIEGVLPNDHPLDGMKAWGLKYRVSQDGGRTGLVEEHVVQRGGYTPEHPVEHVWIGRNSLMWGAENSVVRAPQGHLVAAAMFTPLGPDGQYHNPTGDYTWTEVLILFGAWQRDGRIEWDLGPRIAMDPSRSTRGAIEPTLALMPGGRILMVMRGSNGVRPDLPGHKWFCVSQDGGRTWSDPAPWRYSDGSPFFSPSSISQLVPHSSGRHYWFGNLCEQNPRGNSPRYPLVVGEVDNETMMLVRDSLCVVDDRGPDDPASLCLSNFSFHEDRETGDLAGHMTRLVVEDDGTYGGDAYAYRVHI